MRVLQINSVCQNGSTGRIALDIYNSLISNGDECLIVYGRGLAPENINSCKIGSELSVKLHGVISRITDRQGFMSPFATKKLIKKIKEYNPDIIHLHNIHGYYLNVKLLFKFLADYNKPVVWTLHDCWAFTGHCAYYSYAKCNKWKNRCFACPQKKAYPASYFFDSSEINYKDKKKAFTGIKDLTLVTPSYWLKSQVEESFLKKYSVIPIYNGIDLNVFKPLESNFKDKYNISNKKIILGVANIWEPRKGFDDFLKLSKIISDEYVIVLVGLSDLQISSLPKNIIGIKRTENADELVKIYSSAYVYVNLSVEETMGLTTAEALATGTPAIVYNKTAVPEVIDEKSGIVVSAGDVEGVYGAIENLNISSKDCIKRAKVFEKNKQYNKYLELYKSKVRK